MIFILKKVKRRFDELVSLNIFIYPQINYSEDSEIEKVNEVEYEIGEVIQTQKEESEISQVQANNEENIIEAPLRRSTRVS
jgi:hypothetical protein